MNRTTGASRLECPSRPNAFKLAAAVACWLASSRFGSWPTDKERPSHSPTKYRNLISCGRRTCELGTMFTLALKGIGVELRRQFPETRPARTCAAESTLVLLRDGQFGANSKSKMVNYFVRGIKSPKADGTRACPGKVEAGFPKRTCDNLKNLEHIPIQPNRDVF